MRSKRRTSGNPKIKELGIKTRFQPGQSGNPGGRPKTRVLAEMLAAVGNEVEKKSGKTYLQLAAEALVGRAFNGDVGAFKEFADRVDGRATQNVELSGGLQVQHGRMDWEVEYETATPERRDEINRELDDRILAVAAKIMAERNAPLTPEKIYRDRLREHDRRVNAGERHEDIVADFATRLPLIGAPN